MTRAEANTSVPSLADFRALGREYDLVPVAREVSFDTETAVTAYAKIRSEPFAFLLESVVGGESWARYTFLGSSPQEAIRVAKGRVERWDPTNGWRPIRIETDPLTYLDQRLRKHTVAPVAGLPRFFGGAVGYLGYDIVRYIENLPNAPPDDLRLPEAMLMFTDIVIAIDNAFSKAMVIAMVDVSDAAEEAVEARYHEAIQRIDATLDRLALPASLPVLKKHEAMQLREVASSFSRTDFEAAVVRIQEYIRAGDAFQVVISQRLAIETEARPLELYRVLRSLNPSPYLYLLELDGVALIGSSPEVLVRAEAGRVTVRPIAGTRRRGPDSEADEALTRELLADEKERAEHLMLIDLARNDVGRIARFGSVRVPVHMAIERYSHVLHMVSEVEGELQPGLGAMDVLRACFPAGTVSGAPKVRAMEIIDELEPVGRGPYAGAVGYLAYGGLGLDTAIAIRTIVLRDGIAYVHAGAGVVADSLADREYEETLAKAAVLLQTTSCA